MGVDAWCNFTNVGIGSIATPRRPFLPRSAKNSTYSVTKYHWPERSSGQTMEGLFQHPKTFP